jgi:hypothetical protein
LTWLDRPSSRATHPQQRRRLGRRPRQPHTPAEPAIVNTNTISIKTIIAEGANLGLRILRSLEIEPDEN